MALDLVPITVKAARVAALYVAKGGCYFGLPDVDPWDLARDARTYAGPHPVVAHPPCARWCQMAPVNQARYGQRVGDDGGCFAAALSAVRRWGGVLEHPAFSIAWSALGLLEPPTTGGWVAAGDFLGFTCHVEQRWYGHRARKATWLYAARTRELPSLRWGRGPEPEAWISTDRPRADLAEAGIGQLKRAEAAATPDAFRDVLLAIALSVASQEARGAA